MSQIPSPTHTYYMQQAIMLAQQGIYSTRPNPAVGCVIVNNNQVVGQGFHPKAGEPHAEVFALRQAGAKAKGATVYVTLEPCAHYGKTPPCAEALVKAQVACVVVAGVDPNPKVAGKGIAILQAAGIKVITGVCEQQARELNLGFLKTMSGGLPYVRLKLATSLDGRIAMASGESQWITGTAARLDVQRLRALSGAIITGSGTVLADNPSLTVRHAPVGIELANIPQPLRVVIDRRKRLTAQHEFFAKPAPVLLAGHHLAEVNSTAETDLVVLLQLLKDDYQIHDVLVEAGSQLASSFIERHLVDELIVYQAPCLLGASAQPMFSALLTTLNQQYRYHLVAHDKIGQDVRLVLRK